MLEALARGLRAAGGVLSPNVSQQLAQEGLQDQVAERQMAMQMLQQRIADQRGQALARAVGPALEGGDFEAAARAAASSGAPGGTQMAMNLLGQVEARRARAEQLQTSLQMKQLELRQRHLDKLEELKQKGADTAALQAERLAFQRDMAEFQANARRDFAQFAAGLRPPRSASPVTVLRDGKEVVIDANSGNVIGDAVPKAKPTDTRQIVALSKDLDKAGLAEGDAVIGAVEDAIRKNPDIASYISGPKSALPDLAVPQEVREARQAAQKLFNITLKNRSGAAVTNQELERLKKEFASGVWKTPQQYIAGVEQARNVIQKHYASIAAGYGPEVLREYNNNVRGLGGRVVLEAPAAGPKAGDVVDGYKFKGGNPADSKNWEKQ